MEDIHKVQEVIARLNHEEVSRNSPAALADGGTWSGNWQAEPGYYAVMKFQSTGVREGQFIPTAGIPLKIFVNSKTGEVRTFLISDFEV